MPFTENEIVRITIHLGYTAMQTSVVLSFGLPIPEQCQFLLQRAIPLLPESAIEYVRRILTIMDDIMFNHMVDPGLIALAADRLEDLDLRKDHLPALRTEYRYWQRRLAMIFNVPVNPDHSADDVDAQVGNATVWG